MDKIYEFLAGTLGKVSGKMGVAVAVGLYTGWHFLGGFKKGWSDKKLQRVFKRSDISNDGYLSMKAICYEIKGILDADRVNVYSYSNGIKDKTGLCYDFVSVIGEACKEGVESIFDKLQNTPINPHFRGIIDRIQRSNGCLRIAAKEEEGELRLLNKDYGVETSFNFILAGQGGSVWEGVVSVSYMNEDKILTELELEKTKHLVHKIHNIKKSISNH